MEFVVHFAHLCVLVSFIFSSVVSQRVEAQSDNQQAPQTKNKTNKRTSCFSFLSSTPGKAFSFGKNKIIYVLANTGKLDKRKFKQDLYVHKVMRFDLTQMNLQVLSDMTKSLPRGSLFLPFGDPPTNYTSVAFEPIARECQNGYAHIFFSHVEGFKKDKVVAIKRKIRLVGSHTLTRYFDIDSVKILEVDITRHQFRKLNQKIVAGMIPLYSEPNRILYSTKFAGDGSGLLIREGTKVEQLIYDSNSKILRQGAKFGIGKIHPEKNRLEIIELPNWSGRMEKKRRYLIELPRIYPLSEAEIIIDFKKKILAIGGAVSLSKKRWQRIFFYNYKQGKLLYEFNYENGLIPNTMEVDPESKLIAADFVRADNYRTIYLGVFDLENLSFRKLSMKNKKK